MTVPGGARARLALLAVALVGVLAVAVAVRAASTSSEGGGSFDRVPYEGLGAWVDVYDYAPAYQKPGLLPTVTPSDVDAMADLGVKTLFLQAARNDDKSPQGIVDRDLLGQFLERAHRRGVKVVGWYLPKHLDTDADLERLLAIANFGWKGQHFDGVTVDIEDVTDVTDVNQRNARLVDLSRQLKEELGPDAVIGATVPPAVQLDVVNPAYWPAFPWKQIAPYYDVWLPMTYWSLRRADWKDAYRYTVESVRRMRDHLGEPDAAVHPVGGIGDAISEADVADFLRALTDTDAIGGSIYDYRTMSGGQWGVLRTYLAGALRAPPGSTTTQPEPATTTTTTLPPPTTVRPTTTTVHPTTPTAATATTVRVPSPAP